jgi:hypothetical protein
MDASTLPRYQLSAVAWTQWAYWCSLVMAVMAIRYIPEGSVRNTVMLTPVLTAALCLSMAFWLYEACDEYLRSAVLRCVARTAAIVAGGTVAYFIAELAGAPKLSMLWVKRSR